MTAILYTAKRELTGLNAVDSTVLIEIGISDYSAARAVIKDVARSKGGKRETLYHRTDETHSITFIPVNGQLRKQLFEFLASTESGETFQLYLYGTESTPIQCVREDEGHTDSMFMGVGTSEKDYFQASITVMEA